MLVLAAVAAGDGPIALVLAIVAVASAAGSAERPAALAVLPRLVGEARIGPANALLHTVQDLAVVVGPAIGALIFAVSSASAAFIANAATFAVAALLFATLGRPKSPVASLRAAGHAPASPKGCAQLASHPSCVPLFVLVAMVEFTYGAQTVQLVIYADKSLNLGTGGYGVLLAACGAGGLVSAVVNGQLATARRLTLVVVGATVLACASQLVYAAHASLALALLVTVIGGAGIVCCEVVSETVLARVTPREALGRVAGLFDASSIGAMVSGAVLASILIRTTSLRSSFWILGAGTVLVAADLRPRAARSRRGEPETLGGARVATRHHRASADHARDAATRSRATRVVVAAVSASARRRRRRQRQSGARVLRSRGLDVSSSIEMRRCSRTVSRATASASVGCSTTRRATRR